MKTILTLILTLTVCAATAQTKVSGKIESDTQFHSQVYAETTATTMEWIDWDAWSYYRDFKVTVDHPDNTLELRFIRWADSNCADTTHVYVGYNERHTKIDTTIVLNGGQYVLK